MSFTRVQGSAFTDSGTSATTIPITISAVGSGNAVCGVVTWDDISAAALSSVTDDKGNTYNLETTRLDTVNNQKASAFSRTNITNAPTVITANFSVSIDARKISVDEFSGCSTASSDERDGHSGAFNNGVGTGTDALTSGTFTTGTNGDLIWGACIDTGASGDIISLGTSFSDGTRDDTFTNSRTEFRTQTTAGAGTAATFTQGQDHQRCTFGIAIKPATGGGAAPPNGWWRDESENLPKPPVRFHPPPAFISTFRTAIISGTGWHRDFPEASPRPPVRFHPPPAFVSTFKTAVVSGVAFARSEPESVPRPARRFEFPPAWDPRVITPVVVTSFNGWFVNPEVLKKGMPPIDVPSTVPAPLVQAPRGWFVVPEHFRRKFVPIEVSSVILSPPTGVPRGWFVVPEITKPRPVFFEQPIGFVSNFQTAGIDGIAWMTPIDMFPFRHLILNDPSQVYAPQQQVVVAVVYSFMFPDVYKLRPVPRDDAPAFGRSVVDTSVIGWLNQPAQDRYGLNIRMDTSPALSLTPATLPVPISGMAWFAPVENATINRGVNANTIAAWLPQAIVQIVSGQRPGVNRLKTVRGSSLSSLSRRISGKI